MSCNVGGIERPIRMVMGILLMGTGLFAGLPAAGAGGTLAVGAVLLLTGAIGFCPLSALFGINTCANKPGAKR